MAWSDMFSGLYGGGNPFSGGYQPGMAAYSASMTDPRALQHPSWIPIEFSPGIFGPLESYTGGRYGSDVPRGYGTGGIFGSDIPAAWDPTRNAYTAGYMEPVKDASGNNIRFGPGTLNQFPLQEFDPIAGQPDRYTEKSLGFSTTPRVVYPKPKDPFGFLSLAIPAAFLAAPYLAAAAGFVGPTAGAGTGALTGAGVSGGLSAPAATTLADAAPAFAGSLGDIGLTSALPSVVGNLSLPALSSGTLAGAAPSFAGAFGSGASAFSDPLASFAGTIQSLGLDPFAVGPLMDTTLGVPLTLGGTPLGAGNSGFNLSQTLKSANDLKSIMDTVGQFLGQSGPQPGSGLQPGSDLQPQLGPHQPLQQQATGGALSTIGLGGGGGTQPSAAQIADIAASQATLAGQSPQLAARMSGWLPSYGSTPGLTPEDFLARMQGGI